MYYAGEYGTQVWFGCPRDTPGKLSRQPSDTQCSRRTEFKDRGTVDLYSYEVFSLLAR